MSTMSVSAPVAISSMIPVSSGSVNTLNAVTTLNVVTNLYNAAIAATAERTLFVDFQMSDLSRRKRGAMKQLAVQNDSAADAGAQSQRDQTAAAAAGSELVFGQRHDVGVIVNAHFHFQFFFEDCFKGRVFPARNVGEKINKRGIICI